MLIGILMISVFSGCVSKEKEKIEETPFNGFQITDLGTGCYYSDVTREAYSFLTAKSIYDKDLGRWVSIAPEVREMHEWMIERKSEGLRIWGWCDPLIISEKVFIGHHEFIKKAEKVESIHFDFKLIEEGSEIYYQAQYTLIDEGVYYVYIIKDFFADYGHLKYMGIYIPQKIQITQIQQVINHES